MARKKPTNLVQQAVESRAERKARQYGHQRRSSNEVVQDGVVSKSSKVPELPQLTPGTRRSEAYLQADDKHFLNFRDQLASLGLMLRDIPGDGNCLFRALSDQLDGHMSNHMLHRMNTVRFMIENRTDFEPFMDMPFEGYVDKLARPGTYAGQDVLVAFARNYKVNIVIHQLNSPTWKIEGAQNCDRELHLSYHNGEHYSSVRRIGDTTPNAPANIRMSHQMQPYVPCCTACTQPHTHNHSRTHTTNAAMTPYQNAHYNTQSVTRAFGDSETNDTDAESGTEYLSTSMANNDVAMASGSQAQDVGLGGGELMLQRIMDVTNCYDVELVQQVMLQNDLNEDLCVEYLLQLAAVNMNQQPSPPPALPPVNDTRADIKSAAKTELVSDAPGKTSSNGSKASKLPTKKLTNRERKEQQRKAKQSVGKGGKTAAGHQKSGSESSTAADPANNDVGEPVIVNHLGMLNL